MAKKERAPKKEKLTQREKEILKKSAAEKRESRKSNGINAIITVVIVVVLIAVATLVGLLVKDNPSDPSSANTDTVHNRDWLLTLLSDYDGTLSYLNESGLVLDTDYSADYDASKAEENGGLVGAIKSTLADGLFEIYYFAETETFTAANNASAYYETYITPQNNADENLLAISRGKICILGKGETFQNLFWKYYLIR